MKPVGALFSNAEAKVNFGARENYHSSEQVSTGANIVKSTKALSRKEKGFRRLTQKKME
jgi:hypothetical protein